MSLDKYVEQVFPIECKGRDSKGGEVLAQPVEVRVTVYKSPGSSSITTLVRCPYNTGSHGQRCTASHPGLEKLGDGVGCPYRTSFP